MRIFNNCHEMIKEVERDLFEMGIKYQTITVQDLLVVDNPGFETLELNGYSYCLSGFENQREMLKHSGINKEWADLEFEERVSDKLVNPGQAWRKQPELWEKYLRGHEFEYTYCERMRDQLHYVIKELRSMRTTRQAIITIYDQHKDMRNWGGKARVPCSMHYQFLIRDNLLLLIYVMRSCDFMKHFAGDTYLAIKLGEYVAKSTGACFSKLTHFIGSLHAFKVDLEKRGVF